MSANIASTVWPFVPLLAAVGLALGGEPASGPAAAPFRFEGGERIKIVVPKEVGETLEQLVTGDGFVMLPTGGPPVNIKGKTMAEAHLAVAEQIAQRSGAKRPAAAIALLEAPMRSIYVGGEVRTPQAVAIAPGTTLSLAAVLASAGGATADGDLARVGVTQRDADGKLQTVQADASQLGAPGAASHGPLLHPGAVVTVPRGDSFVLAGEVLKPGTYTRRELSLRPGEQAWLTRVLFAGGGLKPAASRKDLRVIRTQPDGTREVLTVNLDAAIRAAAKGSDEKDRAAADVVMLNGDILLAGAAGGVTVLGKVKQPGVYPMTGDKMKLSQAIALAGGFTEFAKTSSITVVHANAPKQPVRVDIGAITREGDLDKDVDLEDGDLVFVSERLL
jgi:protein involved in polysaccharide export with SLBB domain